MPLCRAYSLPRLRPPLLLGCNVTNFVLEKAVKSTAWGQVDFCTETRVEEEEGSHLSLCCGYRGGLVFKAHRLLYHST